MDQRIPDGMDDNNGKFSNLSAASGSMDRGPNVPRLNGQPHRRSNQERGWYPHGNKERLVYVVKHQVGQSSPEMKNDVLTESKSSNGKGSSHGRKEKFVHVEKHQEGRSSPELKNVVLPESKSSNGQWSSRGRKEKVLYVVKRQVGQSSDEMKDNVPTESKSLNREGSSHGRKERSFHVEKRQKGQSSPEPRNAALTESKSSNGKRSSHGTIARPVYVVKDQEGQISHELKNDVLNESKSSNGKGSSHGRKERSFHVEKGQEGQSSPEPKNDVEKEGKSSNGKWSSHGKKERSAYAEKHQVGQSSPELKNVVVAKFKSLNTCDVASEETNTHPISAQKKASEFTTDHVTLSCEKSLTPSASDNGPENSELSRAFDICQCNVSTITLKPSLLDTNRAKRSEMQRIKEVNNGIVLRPGMVLLKSYISISEQAKIVKRCRDLGIGHGGFYQPGYNDGAKLHLKMMCLGKDWDPATGSYDDHRRSDGAKPPVIPDDFFRLVKNAIKDSHSAIERETIGLKAEKLLPWMTPDICLANFYSTTGRLGLHQDRDESRDSIREGLPVVSFSIGDSADFLYGDSGDVERAETVVLESGDVLVFGGPSRNVFHGVTAIKPNTAPKILLDQANLRPGRLNLTFRQY